MPNVFIAFLFLILLFEGFGIRNSFELSPVFIIILFPLLLVHTLFNKNEFYLPLKTTSAFVAFLFFALLSTFFSVDIQESVKQILYLISLFLAFIISFNYKKSLLKNVIRLIFILSLFLCVYSFFLNLHLINFFIPETGYQFVFSRFVSHNHLGDFLVLPIVLLVYNIYKKRNLKISIIGVLLFSPFLILSYSRSAYFAAAFSCLILHLANLTKPTLHASKLISRSLIIIIFLSVILLSIVTSREAIKQPIPSTINTFLVEKEMLNKDKNIHGSRLLYFNQALKSIQEKPMLGNGLGNFFHASQKFAANKDFDITQSAHNIFLEIAVNTGVLGLICYLALIGFLIVYSRKIGLFYALLGMLLLFQTDYVYQVHSFLLLFFVIAGIIHDDKKKLLLSGVRKKILLE